MSVVEAAADGSFDVASWEELKASGNSLFSKKAYAAALDKYTAALAGVPQSQKHFVLGNRSACYFQLHQYSKALADANAALALVPDWDKGLSRKQCILHAMAKQKANRGTSTASVIGSMYNEKAEVLPDNDNSKSANMLWRRLKTSLESRNQTCLDGIFAKLSNEKDFIQLVYPGVAMEDIIKQKLPRSLHQLLDNTKAYEQELIALMPKVEAKANLVLENVKRKGASQGDIMDAATEAMLRPQVFNEAFARELLTMIQRVNTRQHAKLSQDASRIANPHDEVADWELFSPQFTNRLFVEKDSFAYEDDFMGEDYIPLILSDVQRMRKQGKLLQVAHTQGSMRFWNDKGLNDEFPALAEVVEKLHAIPFVLNRLLDLHLCDESKMDAACSTSIVCLENGEAQSQRLDCGPTGDVSDNGYKLTCIYCITENLECGGDLNLLPLAQAAKPTTINAKPDRLWVYKSQEVLNSISTVTSTTPVYYVVFRIHGMSPLPQTP